jgi:hypothetical protein
VLERVERLQIRSAVCVRSVGKSETAACIDKIDELASATLHPRFTSQLPLTDGGGTTVHERTTSCQLMERDFPAVLTRPVSQLSSPLMTPGRRRLDTRRRCATSLRRSVPSTLHQAYNVCPHWWPQRAIQHPTRLLEREKGVSAHLRLAWAEEARWRCTPRASPAYHPPPPVR